MRPSSADTSEPACTKRKMLSMKSSTSWPPSSRKYSAIVRPVSATRMRAPGGSFIWPKTSIVLSMTPAPSFPGGGRCPCARPCRRRRALADAAEGRQAAVLLGEVVDELLDEDRLADAGAAEQADLAALGVRREEVDDLDAGLEHLLRRDEVLDVRGGTVDRPALLDVELLAQVDRLAQHVEDAPERDVADR